MKSIDNSGERRTRSPEFSNKTIPKKSRTSQGIVYKRGQLSVFVIVAIILALGVVIFFVVRGEIGKEKVPVELAPVFDYYRTCIEQEVSAAIAIAEEQGGYVYVTDYAPGSEYAPFSSHLNFLGVPVPYWYYVSGNGLIKEQVPTKPEIESQISRFVEEGLADCNFE